MGGNPPVIILVGSPAVCESTTEIVLSIFKGFLSSYILNLYTTSMWIIYECNRFLVSDILALFFGFSINLNTNNNFWFMIVFNLVGGKSPSARVGMKAETFMCIRSFV